MIKVYTRLAQLSGKGEEWLLDAQGEIIAVFINGNLRQWTKEELASLEETTAA